MSSNLLSTTTRFFQTRGFKVETNARVVGLSGLMHSFALRVSRGPLQLLIDFVEEVEDLLAFYGKALDLRGVPVLALLKIEKVTPEVQQALHCMGNVIAFETLDELEENLSRVLALTETSGKS